MAALHTLSFGACLQTILREKQCSISHLTQKMGKKSQTTVSRVINDQCSYKAAKEFYGQLLLTNFLHLTTGEIDALNRSLEINRIGLDAYRAYQSMWEIFLTDQMNLDDYSLQDLFYQNQHQSTLASLLHTLQNAEYIEGFLFNCYEVKPLVALIDQLFGSAKAPPLSVYHYFEVGSQPQHAVDALLCISKLALYDGYEAFCRVLPDAVSNDSFPIYKNMIRLWATSRDGSAQTYELYAATDGRMYLDAHPANGHSFAAAKEIIVSNAEKYLPVRNQYGAPERGANLLLLSERLLFLEKDRSLRLLWHTMCISCVPPDIFAALLTIAASNLGLDFESEFAKKIIKVHIERYKNIFEKKYTTQMLLEKGSMRHFAQTGYIKDHPLGVPPLSADQRIRMLETLIDAAKSNVYFHLYISKKEEFMQHLDFICIDNLGLYLYDSNANYNMQRRHFDALISIDMLTDCFNNFFDHELLANHVHSKQESILFLESLKQELRDA